MASTIKDVAKLTGLSIGTISKVINGGAVLEINRILIEKAIKELDFKVNETARSLKTNRSKTIGIILPSLENYFCTSVVAYVEQYLSKHGYGTIICNYREDPEVEKEKLNFLVNKMVDGVVIIPSGKVKDEIINILNRDVPVVLIDRLIKGINCDAVLVDNFNASYNAVEQLITRGHKRTAIICGPKDVYTSDERLKGYLAVHENYNLEVDNNLIKFGDYYLKSGYDLCLQLIEMENPPTSIFVTNYDMTLGVITALNEKNIKLSEEISVIGFDNIGMSKIVKPSLSIVIQPMEQIGEAVAHLILKRIKGDKTNYPNVTRLKAELVMKDSVSNVNY
ncbi:MAG TPA: LacI family DNA-binding transcriptional regulator [Ruminiclostridium sp.]